MTAKKKPCKEPGCDRPKFAPYHRCYWHVVASFPPDQQANHSAGRLRAVQRREGYEFRARVPAAEWPDGMRWCAGCQTFAPLWYVSGSRCRGCAGQAAHHGHVQRTYGITGEQYEALLTYQGGRCYICQRKPGKARLAVDHDHRCTACGGSGCPRCVRGLLCTRGDRSCNHGILGNISDLDMARRIVEYLQEPPWRRLQASMEKPPDSAEGLDLFADL